MKNILSLTFLVSILLFAEKGFAQEVEKDKMKPKAPKNSYEIIFDNIETGTSYYRLKQTDYDGNDSYSVLRMVTVFDELLNLNYSVVPNPADKNAGAKIKLVGNPNDVVVISMYDATGKIVDQSKVTLSSAGEASIETSRDIQSGMYFFNATTQAGQSINQKFIVK